MEERKIKVGITHGDINGIGYEAVSYTHLNAYAYFRFFHIASV